MPKRLTPEEKLKRAVASEEKRKAIDARKVEREVRRKEAEIKNYEFQKRCADNDYDRWRGEWFIIGFEVRLSNNPKYQDCEVCQNMAGCYPKTFYYPGSWHIGCHCIGVPIMACQDERDRYMDYQLGISDKPAIVYISQIPEKAKAFVTENKDKYKSEVWYKQNAHFFQLSIK